MSIRRTAMQKITACYGTFFTGKNVDPECLRDRVRNTRDFLTACVPALCLYAENMTFLQKIFQVPPPSVKLAL